MEFNEELLKTLEGIGTSLADISKRLSVVEEQTAKNNELLDETGTILSENDGNIIKATEAVFAKLNGPKAPLDTSTLNDLLVLMEQVVTKVEENTNVTRQTANNVTDLKTQAWTH